MKLVEKIKQKHALEYYKKKLEIIESCCLFSMNLNQEQKDDIILVLRKAIRCCEKAKSVEYISNKYEKNSNTEIMNKQQYNDYKAIELLLHNLVTDLLNDNILNSELKVTIRKYAMGVSNHIRGKINHYTKIHSSK